MNKFSRLSPERVAGIRKRAAAARPDCLCSCMHPTLEEYAAGEISDPDLAEGQLDFIEEIIQLGRDKLKRQGLDLKSGTVPELFGVKD